MTIQSHEDYNYYLHADLVSSGLKRWGIREWVKKPALRYQRMLRKIEYLMNCRRGPLSRLRLLFWRWRCSRLEMRLGVQIPPNVCGPGLAIEHYGLIIIHSETRIGKNCRMHAGVNIGEWNGGVPKVGDNVYIGPGAKLVGGITVGDRVVIGANAVVCKDVPCGVTVGGVPAQVISEKDSSRVIKTPGA